MLNNSFFVANLPKITLLCPVSALLQLPAVHPHPLLKMINNFSHLTFFVPVLAKLENMIKIHVVISKPL